MESINGMTSLTCSLLVDLDMSEKRHPFILQLKTMKGVILSFEALNGDHHITSFTCSIPVDLHMSEKRYPCILQLKTLNGVLHSPGAQNGDHNRYDVFQM